MRMQDEDETHGATKKKTSVLFKDFVAINIYGLINS